MKRWIVFLLSAVILIVNSIPVLAEDKGIQILFTHDLHDNYLPRDVISGEAVVEQGGYARILTQIKEEKRKNEATLLVDAGDFSMGTVFQTLYEDEAPGLRLMGMMGYDVITLGNHEFDFRDTALANMLNAAVESQDILPEIVISNFGKTPEDVASAMTNYGVKPYTLIEKSGVQIGIFGLMGKEAASNAPMSQVEFLDPIEEAKQTVEALKEEGAELIICLSHSGTWEDADESEDELLAEAVPDIDLIVSGHTHTALLEPIQVGDTWIVSAGEYGANLGKVFMKENDDKWQLVDYELISIDNTIEEDQILLEQIELFNQQVEEDYLEQFGFESGEILGNLPYDFEKEASLGSDHSELRLGNLITDAYVHAVQEAEGADYIPIDVAVLPQGVIRGSLVAGEVTVEEAFNVSSLGIGADGVSGYPLVSAYITGEELRDLCEVDASVAPLMSVAQLYTSGLHYTFNPNRLIFDKVTDLYLVDGEGKRVEVEDDRLYRVVAGLYSAQMLSIVGEQSFGILSIEPKDAQGEVITDFESHIIHNQETGAEVKEWVALAGYIQTLAAQEDQVQLMEYSTVEGRKVVDDDATLMARFKQPNDFAKLVYSIVIGIILLIIITCTLCIRSIKNRKTHSKEK